MQVLKKNLTYIKTLFFYVLICFPVYGSQDLSTTLTVKELLIDRSTSSLTESGQITIVSPGIVYVAEKSRSDIRLDYAYNIEMYNGLASEDSQNHSLNLSYAFQHIPARWKTQLKGTIKQSNLSSDGIQDITDIPSNNTRELRTLGINTAFNKQIKQQYVTSVQLLTDYADYEDQPYSESVGANLSISNQVTQNKFYWSSSLSSRQTRTQGDQVNISTLQLGLNYRLNHEYTVYLNNERSETDNVELNELSSILGVNWQITPRSHFNIGTGRRGDDSNYFLDMLFTKKRLSLSVNYKEDVTSSRSDLLLQADNASSPLSSFQSLTITPILQKRTTLNTQLKGKTSTLSLSYYFQTRNIASANSEEEESNGITLLLDKKLTPKSTIALRLQEQETQTSQQNILTDIQLSYQRQLAKSTKLSIELRDAEQQSDIISNEYRTRLIGFTLNTVF